MESKSEMIDWPNITLCSRRSEVFGCNVTFLCWVRQVLTNGSLYVESQLAEEGAYQCRASVSNVGVLLSRLAYVRISCKFILCSFCALFICLSLCWSAQRRDVPYWSINSLVCSLHFCVCLNAPPRPLPPHGHIWDVMLVGWKGTINKNCLVCYSIVYYYNGAHAQRYEQFL